MTRPLLALALAFVLTGCSPLRAVNALVPTDTFRLVADQAWRFLYVMLPLRIKGGTGSPGRPVAIT